jgi:hypothetical protein
MDKRPGPEGGNPGLRAFADHLMNIAKHERAVSINALMIECRLRQRESG